MTKAVVTKHPGQPTKYRKEYCEELIKYFDIEPYYERKETIVNQKTKQKYVKYRIIAHDLPTLAGFAVKLGVCRDTIHEWETAKKKNGKLKHKEFSDAIKRAKDIQENIWAINSFKGLYNPAFTIFAGKNIFNWKDKQDIDHTTGGDKIDFRIISYDEVVKKNE
jgi:hypothetical protein